MTSERFELADSSIKYNSDVNLTMGSDDSRRRGGCHVSTPIGFVLLLLGLLIAVGVGLIVHFAKDSDINVVCDYGSSSSSSAAAQEQCEQLAEQGNMGICSKCPGSSSTSSTTPPPDETEGTDKVTDVRLPDTVLPLHYDVELMPMFFAESPEDFTYTGKVTIYVKCHKATDNISIHAKHLVVKPSDIRFEGVIPNSADPRYINMEIDKDREFIVLILSKNLVVGREYKVTMTYSAVLDNDLKGLYYSTYTRGNDSIYIVTTQFQPTDARRAFPCFDEPALKATFNITLVRPTHLISISNTPIIDNSTTFDQDGMTFVKDIYQTTPKMSTYLLAFIVCDFKYLSAYTANNVLYRAWATPETVNQAEYALEVGVKVLTYFEDFFNISYPLPKQDMIAIPDFAAGAMENWGLITYRETAMLYEPGVSNEANRERIAIVVSHELAHQWFGDLVSPAWWDDLWLNEGFATFVEYLGVDFMHPDWKIFEIFALSEIQGSFYFDGLASSHPLYVPVGHPDEINEIFDTISYAKGASVIRMMRHFLGDGTFKRGLTRYLRSREYDAAFHDDLWASLTEQAQLEGKGHLDVKRIMDTWVLQMNYPVVTVTRDFQNRNQLRVRQERYLMDPHAQDSGKYESPFNYRWTIPLTFTSSKTMKTDHTDADVHWLDKEEISKSITLGGNELPDNDGWILANVNQYGYYRVNYQLGNWEALVKQLEDDHTVLPAINRAQIIDDAWNLAKAGHLPMSLALKTIGYIDKELTYIPWSTTYSQTSYVAQMLSLTPAYGAFRRFMKSKLTAPFQNLGMNNTGSSHVDITARRVVVSLACLYEVEECRAEAKRQFKAWMDTPDKNPVDVELKSTIYCRAINEGGWDEWSFALKMYKENNVASEKSRLLHSMSCSDSPWILNHFLHIILEKNSPIRKQDALSVINGVSSSTIGRPLAWRFFMANYDKLLE
ncbi:aminopeptidase n, partial [Plakobranchus ocellatus]